MGEAKMTRKSKDEIKDAIRDEIASHLASDTYLCTRTWDAWETGTMTENDFTLASEEDGLLDDIAESVMKIIQSNK